MRPVAGPGASPESGVFSGALAVAAAGVGDHQRVGDLAGVAADRGLDLASDLLVLLEERPRVLAALADALAVIGEPRARLLDHARLDAEIDQLAGLGDALAVHDVE